MEGVERVGGRTGSKSESRKGGGDMTVYVDPALWPFGRMKMCHMIADTKNELLEMVDRIGVQRKWIQQPGTDREHFDICKAKRAIAVDSGAIEISPREMATLMNSRRVCSRSP